MFSRLYQSSGQHCLWNTIAELVFTVSGGFTCNLGATGRKVLSLPVTGGVVVQSIQSGEVQVLPAGPSMKIGCH